MQVCVRGVRFFLQQLHDVVAAQISRHQNHGVAEVNFPAFAVAHKAPVKYLIEQVHYVAVRLFHFVEQHHAVRAFANGFGEYATLTVANVARRRPLKLGDGMRLLIFGEVDGDKGFSPPNRVSASVSAVSVLPVPLGPVNRNTPAGRSPA